MKRLVCIVLAAVTMLVPTTADAQLQRLTMPTPTLQEFGAIAEHYWQFGNRLGCGRTEYKYEMLPSDRWGQATLPERRVEVCVIEIDPGLTDWQTCMVVVHEFGHTAGMNHNDDPESVMYFNGPWYGAKVPGCEMFK